MQACLTRQRAGARTDDWAHVVLFYGTCRVVLHAGMLVAGGSHRFVVHGDKGSLVKHAADRQEEQLLAGVTPGAAGWGQDPDDLIVFDPTGQASSSPTIANDQRRYYAGIVAALRDNGQNPVPPRQAVAVMAIVEAALRASTTGTTIDLLPD